MIGMKNRALLALVAAGIALASCSPGGGARTGLSAGLTQPMDTPGASLNRVEALGILNHYRATSGSQTLVPDAALETTAQSLAVEYARTGKTPRRPVDVAGLRTSAGYTNFAETFSGWRNSPADAKVLAEPSATRAGIGVAYDPNSSYGVYWVLLLGR